MWIRDAAWQCACPPALCGDFADSASIEAQISDMEVEARIGGYVRSSQCRIDPSNGQSPVV
jgi:hypothetical protein